MRNNARARDAADVNRGGVLDLDEFCRFVRAREEGEFSDLELRARFAAMDADGSGTVDMSEYLRWSLRDALARSAERVMDLFRSWDLDRSGTVDKEEFHWAVCALGVEVARADTDAVFDSLDDDGSGMLPPPSPPPPSVSSSSLLLSSSSRLRRLLPPVPPLFCPFVLSRPLHFLPPLHAPTPRPPPPLPS